ncbi:spore coat protein [Bacillus infantis]|uniref:spore coat protein n=1 Tax=Bacillus infantis TaxID=324767 RepID=UPI003CEF134A
MQQFYQQGQSGMNTNEQIPAHMNHGGHEMLDMKEVLSSTVAAIDQYLMFSGQIQDPQLKEIANRQRQFMITQYNTMVDCFTTGQKPAVSTTTYMMGETHDVIYGLQPSQPAAPKQSASEIGDQCYSGYLLALMKGAASQLSMAALECTNPVVRRVLADSVPNYAEMAYELFLYQNQKHYYQVPQLAPQDTEQLLGSYTQAGGQQMMNQPNMNTLQ